MPMLKMQKRMFGWILHLPVNILLIQNMKSSELTSRKLEDYWMI